MYTVYVHLTVVYIHAHLDNRVYFTHNYVHVWLLTCCCMALAEASLCCHLL